MQSFLELAKRNFSTVLGTIETAGLGQSEIDSILNSHTFKPLDDYVARDLGLCFSPVLSPDRKSILLVTWAKGKMTSENFQESVAKLREGAANPTTEGPGWAYGVEYKARPLLQKIAELIQIP